MGMYIAFVNNRFGQTEWVEAEGENEAQARQQLEARSFHVEKMYRSWTHRAAMDLSAQGWTRAEIIKFLSGTKSDSDIVSGCLGPGLVGPTENRVDILMEECNWGVGRIVRALKESGCDDDEVVDEILGSQWEGASGVKAAANTFGWHDHQTVDHLKGLA